MLIASASHCADWKRFNSLRCIQIWHDRKINCGGKLACMKLRKSGWCEGEKKPQLCVCGWSLLWKVLKRFAPARHPRTNFDFSPFYAPLWLRVGEKVGIHFIFISSRWCCVWIVYQTNPLQTVSKLGRYLFSPFRPIFTRPQSMGLSTCVRWNGAGVVGVFLGD